MISDRILERLVLGRWTIGMKALRFAYLTTLPLLAACSGTPGPGDSGYPYNIEGQYSAAVTVEALELSGSFRVTTASGGVVSGTFQLTEPSRFDGDVEGTLVNDQLTVRMSYGENPITGCDGGSLSGTLTVAENGAGISGQLTVEDCGLTLPASVRFDRL